MRLVSLVLAFLLAVSVSAQDYFKYSEEALAQELEDLATVERGVLVQMRDGVGLSTNIYRPKEVSGPVPVIFWRTPYQEHQPKGMTLRYLLKALNRGYAFVIQVERGHYFSEGQWEILGHPQTDGYDSLTWLAEQSWSTGRIGTLGCSSSAEWQLALAAQNHPAHVAMVPMAAGAGIGKVGRFQEQGNWYTGGVPRTLFFVWLYGGDNPYRAELPRGLDQATRARIAGYNDLHGKKPDVDWARHIKHLPVNELLSSLGEPAATFEELIDRTPADPDWWRGGLYHDNMGWGVPALWVNSWYDVSIGPNLELFNHARTVNTDREASANQYAIIAPTAHCKVDNLGPEMTVGERSMGDVSFDMDGAVFGWFDRWLKNDAKAFPSDTPRLRYFTMGDNVWGSSNEWPPRTSQKLRLYLRSGGNANSLYGDGRLERTPPPEGEPPDVYAYDPLNPVQTIGGGDCCNGGLVTAGAYDQRVIEARHDVLVYSTDVLSEPVKVTGFVEAVLKVSSSAPDTDFAVKLVDVAPDGTAYILGDTIFRARYRHGYDKPAMMQPGQVHTINPTPITTSNVFQAGHRIRVEITSSNFPKFARNLNTGGNNESESDAVVAENVIHHDIDNASYVELTTAQ